MLTVSGLRAGYGDVEVLHGVDLAVGAHEFVALLGGNGAGKTTLLRTVSGLQAPTGGSVVVDGVEATGTPPHEICRRGVVHVPEGRKLFGGMSVAENLELGAMPGVAMRRRKATVTEVYDRFPVLGDRRRQLAGTLSGGEQQQLAIGRALMGLPRMLLLDEPSQGLAPALTEQVLAAVGELHGDGMTVLLVSQEVAAALDLAQRAYVLANGTVALAGTAAELRQRDEIRSAYLGL